MDLQSTVFRPDTSIMNKEDFGLSKKCRLLSQKDFLYLREGSLRLKSSLLGLYYKKTRIDGAPEGRLGLSVSRKVGKAFVRNRVKRIMRDLFRHSKLKSSGHDFLFVVYPKKRELFSSPKEYEKVLREEFQKLLYRAGKGL